MNMGGSFVLSDDSHGVEQVAWGYDKILDFMHKVGVNRLTVFERGSPTFDGRFPGMTTREVLVSDLECHPSWSHQDRVLA